MSAFQYSVEDLAPNKAGAKRLTEAAAATAASPGPGGAPRSVEEQALIRDTAIGIGPLIVAGVSTLTRDRDQAPGVDEAGEPLPPRTARFDVRVVGEVLDAEHVRVNVFVSGGLGNYG